MEIVVFGVYVLGSLNLGRYHVVLAHCTFIFPVHPITGASPSRISTDANFRSPDNAKDCRYVALLEPYYVGLLLAG